MMERFPTWRIWELLQPVPSKAMYSLLPYMKGCSTPKNPLLNVVTWIAISASLAFGWYFYVFNLLYYIIDNPFPGWILSLPPFSLITVHTLVYGTRVASSIAKHREAGNFELFKLLPAGELNMTLDITRVYRHSFGGELGGLWAILFVIVFGVPCMLLSLQFPQFETIMAVWALVFSVVYFVTYLQSFVSITLIALLTSQHQKRAQVQTWTIVCFVALQVGVCIGLSALLDVVTVFILQINRESLIFENNLLALLLVWILLLCPLILMGGRELVNFGLWQAVKRRLEAE